MEIVPGLHWVDGIFDAKVYLWLEGDRVVLIDAATPHRETAILRYLALLGYQPQAIAEIWLTHAHLDHMGSAEAIKQRSGARVVTHRADVPLAEGKVQGAMASPRAPALLRSLLVLFGRILGFQPVQVDRAVEDGDWLGEWQVVHVPGHTPGSVCFFHPRRRIALVGDAINNRRGRLGPPPSLFSDDLAQAYASIEKIARLDFEVCCVGHGAPVTENARQRVQELAKLRRSADVTR